MMPLNSLMLRQELLQGQEQLALDLSSDSESQVPENL
ncbi:MAG: Uncharacterised protein [Prochlorococcus marinus str. MIT 9215]|nr:MAG: Uncharacterised protein [Prochlorococcus marinus str. MIT 9215]